jgi:hypothetical protein
MRLEDPRHGKTVWIPAKVEWIPATVNSNDESESRLAGVAANRATYVTVEVKLGQKGARRQFRKIEAHHLSSRNRDMRDRDKPSDSGRHYPGGTR